VDTQLRELERLAKGGDPDAALQLIKKLKRLISASWIITDCRSCDGSGIYYVDRPRGLEFGAYHERKQNCKTCSGHGKLRFDITLLNEKPKRMRIRREY